MKTKILITIEHPDDRSADGLITYHFNPMLNDMNHDLGEGYSVTLERLTEKLGAY
jgi:hypothetical protein